MRIGIDARELCGRPTGVGRYLGALLGEWAAGDHGHEFMLYSSGPGEALERQGFATRIIDGAPGTWWEQVRLPRAAAEDRLDVFFAPAYTAPLRIGVPTVVTIHDISFVAHPEWFRMREGLRRRWLTRRTAARAATIVTVSEFSKRELVDRLGVPDARIRVIPHGIDTTSRALSPSRPGPPSVLFVGSIFNRRHVPDLIRAFGRLARRHPEATLDVVGDNRSYPHEDLPQIIAAEQLVGRVHWHRFASDAELQQLYARARAFAFLSEYEGFGLTPVEAIVAGVPPVLLDTPVARESCGDAALYVPAGDMAATTRALELALFDVATRERLFRAAPGVIGRYSWARAARATLQAIEQAASPHPTTHPA